MQRSISAKEKVGATVLYVDNSHYSRQLYSILLGRVVTKLHVAEDVPQGMEVLRKHQVDVVVTDYDLPSANGIRFSSMVKEISPSTSVILVSRYDDPKFVQDSRNAGISLRLTKPMKQDDLKNAIIRAIAPANA